MRFWAFIVLLWGASTFAQKVPTRIQDFQANPDQGGRRIFIKGADASPAGNGVMDVTRPHVETFTPAGAVHAIIDASQAYFDQARSHDVWSAKDLSMKTADGLVAIKGVGFRWTIAQSQLTISNRVEATLRRQNLIASATTPSTAPAASTNFDTIQITADQMVYTEDTVTFTGNVHVVDRQGEVRCRFLKVSYSGKTLHEIEAIDDVILSQGATQARGKRALYSPATGLLRLIQNTTWKLADRDSEGESELLILDRTNNTIRAEARVRMSFPSTLLSTNAPGSANRATTANSTNRVVIHSDTFDYATTNITTAGPIAIFNGNVHALDPQANLDCQLLTIFFNRSNQLVRAIADREVHITRPDTEVQGERAVFENDEVTITGAPKWTHEKQSGNSDILIFNPRTREIRAANVRMNIPFSSRTNLLTAATNAAPNITTNILVVTSAYFTNKDNTATFAENVRATEPGGQIDANRINVEFKTNRIDRIHAFGDVILTQERSQAIGQEAIYDTKTQTMRLRGNPKLIGEESEIIAREFIRTTQHFKPLPPFQMILRQKGTNSFKNPFLAEPTNANNRAK